MQHLNDGRNKTPKVECGRSLRSRPGCALIQARPTKAGFSLALRTRPPHSPSALALNHPPTHPVGLRLRTRPPLSPSALALRPRHTRRGLPRPRTPAAYGFRFGAPSPSSRSPAAEWSPRPCRVKLLCGGLRPALTGSAASGRAGACSNARSVFARLPAWPLFATKGAAPLPPRPLAGYSFAKLILPPARGRGRRALRAATTGGVLRPRSLVAAPATPICRRRLTPPLGARLRTDRAQSGRDSPLLGPRFALPAGPLVASG